MASNLASTVSSRKETSSVINVEEAADLGLWKNTVLTPLGRCAFAAMACSEVSAVIDAIRVFGPRFAAIFIERDSIFCLFALVIAPVDKESARPVGSVVVLN